MQSQLPTEKAKNEELERELRYEEKAWAEAAALLVMQKNGTVLGGPRGRMVSASDGKDALMLIDEARRNGARLGSAGDVLSISVRTYHLIKTFKTAEVRTKSRQRLKRFLASDLAIIDVSGFLPITKQESNLLLQIVAHLQGETESFTDIGVFANMSARAVRD